MQRGGLHARKGHKGQRWKRLELCSRDTQPVSCAERESRRSAQARCAVFAVSENAYERLLSLSRPLRVHERSIYLQKNDGVTELERAREESCLIELN